jgi:TolB-like protein/DNA-binding winged helix-turn-helix (wHTH) protein
LQLHQKVTSPARIGTEHFALPEKKPPTSGSIVRFGVFEVNFGARELRKHGVRVRLPGQPFSLLRMLLQKPGEVVTREEMRLELWREDTFVDFEHSLNSAVKKLRSALGDTPENPRYIETVPRVGYRFVAPVTLVATAEVIPASSAAPATPTHLPAAALAAVPEPHSHRRGVAIGVVIGVVFAIATIAIYSHWIRPRNRASSGSQRLMLAVLPFENLTGDPGQDYFSDGLTEEMISQLGRLDPQHLGVIARTSVMHYKDTKIALPQIAAELNVQYVLEGSVRREAGKVRVSAQLIQVKDQSHVWSREYDRELSDLLSLQSEIARQVSDGIQATLGNPLAGPAPTRPAADNPPYEVYDLYMKGRYYWNKRNYEGFQQAVQYFQQAIGKDPAYAPAYSGLADTYALMSSWHEMRLEEAIPKARAAALRALDLDDSLPEAHASLALIAENYDYDWQTAEKQFQRAIELDPNYPTAHQWYAEMLSYEGRFDGAFAESERARVLDPLSLIIAADHAAILYYARRFDESTREFRAVLDMDHDFARAHMVVLDYVALRDFPSAMADIEVRRRAGVPPADLAGEKIYAYAIWGKRGEALGLLGQYARKLPSLPLDRAVMLVRGYAALGENDRAIAILQRAYAAHSEVLTSLKVEPGYDPLRTDPRYQELLRKVGLSQ